MSTPSLTSIVLALLSFSLPDSSTAQRSQPCFDEDNPPSCDGTGIQVDESSLDVHSVCWEIGVGEGYSLIFSKLEDHASLLSSIPADSELCDNLRQAYHLCYWCSPEFDEFLCPLACNAPPEEMDPEVDIEATCEELSTISSERGEWPATIELCHRAAQSFHQCPNALNQTLEKPICSDAPPCFREDAPLCSSKGIEVHPLFDAQDVCWLLAFEAYGLAWIDPALHRDFFNSLTEDSDLCEPFRQAYHQCYWCSPEYDYQDIGNHYCIQNSFSCDEPKVVDETVDVDSTCSELEALHAIGQQPVTLDLCHRMDQSYHHCPVYTSGECSSDRCFDKKNPPSCASRKVDESLDVNATCTTLYEQYGLDYYYPEDIPDLLSWMPATHHQCSDFRQAFHLCRWCVEGNARDKILFDYLGADTTAKKKALVWTSRSSAFLSFFGACFILWDALSQKRNRKTVYHQLLVAMAIFDICTAAAWSFATAPIPQDEGYNVLGAVGNTATCKAQGFFVQLGFTSVFYNVSLASYYVLVIIYGQREGELRKIRPLLHGFPLVVGAGLAFGGLPVYDWIEYGCHLEPPPKGEIWESLVFAVLPIGFSIAFISVAMIAVYLSVRSKSRASQKWSLNFGSANPLEQKVFWQSLFYTLSFYITWPVVFAVYIKNVDYEAQRYGVSVLVAFCGPLQGFNNFLVYARPRLLKGNLRKSVRSWLSRKSAPALSGLLGRKLRGRRTSSESLQAGMGMAAATTTQATQVGSTVDPSASIASVDPTAVHDAPPNPKSNGVDVTEESTAEEIKATIQQAPEANDLYPSVAIAAMGPTAGQQPPPSSEPDNVDGSHQQPSFVP